MRCPSCASELAAWGRFCPSCGQPAAPLSELTTSPNVINAGVRVLTRGVNRLSSESVPVGGLTPGSVLAGRYRIVGLLGRGGMGEVYRADDTKLGQTVALKFLPREMSPDPVWRERFFAEVRIARQLSHPNICRVYDVADIDGRHVLSMEYIDGEDLASLLKRVGSLSNEKSLDVARQLAAGLAAAHAGGVLHRDLKPANVMIDGHGRARITDFGLAVAMTNEPHEGEVAGTPAYMAPEQLAGKGATVRSDIYGLGLVLYEACCGQRAFPAATLADLRDLKEHTTPRSPSDIRPGLDFALERVIMHCIERDPQARPASVAQLAASLPGGDPLAAAIAAGETPSPELVAAAGLREGLSQPVAVVLLVLGARSATFASFFVLFVLFVLRVVARTDWIVFPLFVIVAGGSRIGAITSSISIPVLIAGGALRSFTLVRIGLIAEIVGGFVWTLLANGSTTLHTSDWYASGGYVSLALIGALAAYGFATATAGRSSGAL